jgi:hypothetical protein
MLIRHHHEDSQNKYLSICEHSICHRFRSVVLRATAARSARLEIQRPGRSVGGQWGNDNSEGTGNRGKRYSAQALSIQVSHTEQIINH